MNGVLRIPLNQLLIENTALNSIPLRPPDFCRKPLRMKFDAHVNIPQISYHCSPKLTLRWVRKIPWHPIGNPIFKCERISNTKYLSKQNIGRKYARTNLRNITDFYATLPNLEC